jgi:hypothetical protein
MPVGSAANTGRTAHREDVLFLASDEAALLTGDIGHWPVLRVVDHRHADSPPTQGSAP